MYSQEVRLGCYHQFEAVGLVALHSWEVKWGLKLQLGI